MTPPDKNILYHTGSSVRLPSCCKHICHVVTAFSLWRVCTVSNSSCSRCYSFWVSVKSIFNNTVRAEHKEGLMSPPAFPSHPKVKYIIRGGYLSMIYRLGVRSVVKPNTSGLHRASCFGVKYQLWMPTKTETSKTCSEDFNHTSLLA